MKAQYFHSASRTDDFSLPIVKYEYISKDNSKYTTSYYPDVKMIDIRFGEYCFVAFTDDLFDGKDFIESLSNPQKCLEEGR